MQLEQYELVEYPPKGLREEEYARRAAKRAEKWQRLNEQDEMKFSHSIQFNAVPDWTSHYIAYSNLKKLSVSLYDCISTRAIDAAILPRNMSTMAC